MGIIGKIGQFAAGQRQIIRDFYYLDYWADHSLTQGFAEAAGGASERLDSYTEDKGRFIRSFAGAGMGAATILAGIPIGIDDWAIKTMKEIPNGPGKTLYTFLKVPIMGSIGGARCVYEKVLSWKNGALLQEDSYKIANDVTGTLATAGMLLLGAKGIKKGVSGRGPLLEPAFAEATEAPTMALVFDVAKIGGIAKDVGTGIFYMSSSGKAAANKGGGDIGAKEATAASPPTNIMGRGKKFTEARIRVAKELGIPPEDVHISISVPAEYGSLMRDLSDLHIALTVIKHQGNKTAAASELGVGLSYIVSRFRRCRENSPLNEPMFEERFVGRRRMAMEKDPSRVFPLDSLGWRNFLEKYGYKGISAIPDETIAVALEEFLRKVEPPTEAEFQAHFELVSRRLEEGGFKPHPREWTDKQLIEYREGNRRNPARVTEEVLWELREEDIRIDWNEIEMRVIGAAHNDPASLLANFFDKHIFEQHTGFW